MATDKVRKAAGIQALLHEALKGVKDHAAEGLCLLGVGFAEGKVQHGLAAVTVAGHGKIHTHAGIQHRA